MSDFKDDLVRLIAKTLQDPQGAARQIIAIELSKPVLWNLLLLIVILSVLLTYGTVLISGQAIAALAMAGSPMMLTLLFFGQLVLLVFAIFWTGKALGGTGRLEDFAALLAWLQTIWLIAQVFQSILLVVSPSAAQFFGVVAIVYGLWIVSNFIAVAHGFPSWVKGVGVLVLSTLGVVVGLSVLLSIIGISTLGLSLNV